jgi:hypothetical protein
MAELTHAAIASLDEYVEDEEGKFDWAVPDEEGAELAGNAIGAGLVDECHLFLFPVVVGGGKRTRVNRC